MLLTGEMLERVRNGAAPVPPRDRRRYYDLVSASLRRCPLLTNAALMDAIRRRSANCCDRRPRLPDASIAPGSGLKAIHPSGPRPRAPCEQS
jgi:hypothetical protein